MSTRLAINTALVIAALSMLATGVWAWFDPAGFAAWANWPNHIHFLHDAGTFQMGIGLMLLWTLLWRDAAAVVLAGFVFTNTFHALNHALDLHMGGNASDPWTLLALSAVGAVGLVIRLRVLRRRPADTEAAK
ncbi:hypothetical protein [Glycomyces tritici]|uniref:DUF4383 domain-containing protein n=1 Tax=Glycomyces tritici TaxID=2665176 RepID=A0ABT7YUJ2_9ACTN|nr:hypothetical protein [Glycomyces tritici]MDN3242029.1 hypothetical protein [Glycomyces tritici]